MSSKYPRTRPCTPVVLTTSTTKLHAYYMTLLHKRIYDPQMSGHATCAGSLHAIQQVSEGMVLTYKELAVCRSTVTSIHTTVSHKRLCDCPDATSGVEPGPQPPQRCQTCMAFKLSIAREPGGDNSCFIRSSLCTRASFSASVSHSVSMRWRIRRERDAIFRREQRRSGNAHNVVATFL